jgi:hypothetical protein
LDVETSEVGLKTGKVEVLKDVVAAYADAGRIRRVGAGIEKDRVFSGFKPAGPRFG